MNFRYLKLLEAWKTNDILVFNPVYLGFTVPAVVCTLEFMWSLLAKIGVSYLPVSYAAVIKAMRFPLQDIDEKYRIYGVLGLKERAKAFIKAGRKHFDEYECLLRNFKEADGSEVFDWK